MFACMGFNNPAMPWSELETKLSGRRPDGRAPGSPSWNAGGDGPAWSRKRQPYEPHPGLVDPDPTPGRGLAAPAVPYAELHCHSNFSFLDGASHPEELVEEAVRLGLEALALTDHHGLYGVVRLAEAARAVGLPTVFGAEVTLVEGLDRHRRLAQDEAATQRQVTRGATPPAPQPDPHGEHLVLLADGPEGYSRLSRTLSLGHLAGEKGAPRCSLADLAHTGAGHWWVLTGCRKGVVPRALVSDGPRAARRELHTLIDAFGRDRVAVELWDHGNPMDSHRNDALAELAMREGLTAVATNNVHYATPSRRTLATALAAVRSRRSLDDLDPWLPATSFAHLRSGAEQARRFARYPGVVQAAADLGRAAAFDLALIAPQLPPYPCPAGMNEMQYLRHVTEEGARRRYGERPFANETSSLRARAWATIDRELGIVEQLGFPGYFLVVWDLVEFCRRENIYCQGRGSAANSAVCYSLGITKADAVSLGLLFERFLSPERDGPPDIDIDIESDRREEVIQYAYARYGRHHAAQVANVITYRSRSSVRDMARALGFAPGQQDAWSKQVDAWGSVASTAAQRNPDGTPAHDIPDAVLDLAAQVEDFPRHLGIHSGGMVICDRPIIEVCPVEWARMERRSVLQWDKDDCAAAGLVKFDLLGLGMLSALHYAVDLIAEHRGYQIDLATIPQEVEVYDMLCRADTVGVFQVESRAQMATLPRLKPRTFYDLVVEVALIRPGPIQGGSVHPYIRRRNGLEPVTYLHPLLENSLAKTLGVPLFQEQLMQMAIDVAGFTPSEADQLRQAMGSKRSRTRMERLRERLYDGMHERGITPGVANEIFAKMAAFANYGFPESHSVSFAYLVYASSWIKYHEPAAFCAALLNAQPMGFWSPHSLVQDARRHGVVTLQPCVNASRALATLEPHNASQGGPDPSKQGLGVRLALSSVRGVSHAVARAIEAGQPFATAGDLVRRVPALTLVQLESLATAGAFACFGMSRREALWAAGAVNESRPGRLPGIVSGVQAPCLPGMDEQAMAVADLWATGVSPDGHPTRFVREALAARGVRTAEQLRTAEPGSKVLIAGVVTHRQRPMTAQGTTFMNLEDETGLMNVVVSKGCWKRHRAVARDAGALLVSGRLERSEGVVNVVAERIEALSLAAATASRNFR
uniref:Error-prone DNA polymerase n=1 Tax=freshwater metagenome TaxID=449393 RepID=A0A6J7MXQ8_9ZZZZ